MIYRIALRASEEGYSASVPGLPGCWSQGATETEALENIREAIREYLAVAAELTQGAEIREVDVAVQPWGSSPASTIWMPCAPSRKPVSALLGKANTSS